MQQQRIPSDASRRSQTQRPHHVRFHEYDILERADLQGHRTEQWLPGAGTEEALYYKDMGQGVWGVMEGACVSTVVVA